MSRPELCRLVGPAAFSHDAEIIAPPHLQISPEQKLRLLKQLDRWRQWKSLDDQRLCLGCGRLINGHDIEVIPVGANGDTELHCPSEGCQSIPLDWILPTSREREGDQKGSGS